MRALREIKTIKEDNKELRDVTKLVELAEKYGYAQYIRIAEQKVNELPDSEEKTELLNRLQDIK